MGKKIENKKTRDSQIKAVQAYDTKTYDRITFRVKKGYSEELKELVKPDTLNGFITKAVEQRLRGDFGLNIPDLSAYARSSGMTEEEYIKAAVMEKMQKQDAEYQEDITRERVND
jgi:hypothetical protein